MQAKILDPLTPDKYKTSVYNAVAGIPHARLLRLLHVY